MTGAELFEALSFIDEKYIQEADMPRNRAGVPWMKILSVAACLCILIAGAFAMEHMGHKSAKEEAAAPAAPMEAPAATEAAPRQESAQEESGEVGVPEAAAGELQHVPYATLRILEVLEDGTFVAVVEEVGEDPTPLEPGTELTVMVDPAMVPGADAQISNDLSGIDADTPVAVENGAYDAGTNTLYAAQLFPVR